MQTVNDQLICMFQIGCMAIVMAIIACFYGLRASGGPAGVGTAVARGVVVNLVVLHLIGAFLTVFFYGADVKLPIGG